MESNTTSSDYERGREGFAGDGDVEQITVPLPLLLNCRAALASGHRSDALLGALDRWIAQAHSYAAR